LIGRGREKKEGCGVGKRAYGFEFDRAYDPNKEIQNLIIHNSPTPQSCPSFNPLNPVPTLHTSAPLRSLRLKR
jgi:hypothetical protein